MSSCVAVGSAFIPTPKPTGAKGPLWGEFLDLPFDEANEAALFERISNADVNYHALSLEVTSK